MSSAGAADTLRVIAAAVRTAALVDRDAIACGPYRLSLWRGSRLPILNVAVPVERGAADWGVASAALVKAFVRRWRRPRVELFPTLHPEADAALTSSGWRTMSALTVLAQPCPQGGADAARAVTNGVLAGNAATGTAATGGADGQVRRLSDRDPDRVLQGWLDLHAVAFGFTSGRLGGRSLEDLRSELREPQCVALALEIEGAIVGAVSMLRTDPWAVMSPVELAGLAIRPDHRLRGLARRLCAHALAAASADGPALVWLAADPVLAARLYAPLGFVGVGDYHILECRRDR